MQHRLEESSAFGLRRGELRLQPIAHGHQFFDFGDDAVLFVDGRNRDRERTDVVEIQSGLARTIRSLKQFRTGSL